MTTRYHYCNYECSRDGCGDLIGVIDHNKNATSTMDLFNSIPTVYSIYGYQMCSLNPMFAKFQSTEQIDNVFQNEVGYSKKYYQMGGVTLNQLTESTLSVRIQAEDMRSYQRYFAMMTDALQALYSEKRPVSYTYQRAIGYIGKASTSQSDTVLTVLFFFSLLPLAMSSLLPAYMYQRTNEQGSSLEEYVRMLGVTKAMDELAKYIFDYATYFFIMIVVLIQGIASNFSYFRIGNPLHYLFLMFLWGHVQIVVAFSLQSFFKKARTASIVGYAIVFATMGVGIFSNMMLFDMNLPPWWYMLSPHLVLYRAVITLQFQYYDKRYLQFVGPISLDNQLVILYAILVAHIIVYFLIGVLLYRFMIFYRKYEHKLHFKVLWSKIRPKKTIVEEKDFVAEQVDYQQQVATQVSLEKCVVVTDLCKSYGTRSVLRNLNMEMNSNECFGLLGKNGAGKTSFINILCKIAPQDSGSITVNELSLDEAHKRNYIALCPQFDILFDDLSVEDHILFLIRLKRVVTGFKNEYAHAEHLIIDFGLDEARRRLAKDLSGGMKRRLSLAMSLVGSPKVVLLDEPTTGLDPATRRDVWKVINSAVKSQDRCVMLTTHSMEEAEALCNRIGVMHHGSLKCVGTSAYLKNKYGGGYKISINLQPIGNAGLLTIEEEVRRRATAFVQSMMPEAVVEYQSNLFYIFRVHNIGMKLSELFKLMDTQHIRKKFLLSREDGFVVNWSVNSSSLEELFFKVVKPSMLQQDD